MRSGWQGKFHSSAWPSWFGLNEGHSGQAIYNTPPLSSRTQWRISDNVVGSLLRACCNQKVLLLRAGISMKKIPHCVRDDKARFIHLLGHHDLDWMKAIQAKQFIIHLHCHPERSEGSQTMQQGPQRRIFIICACSDGEVPVLNMVVAIGYI